MNKDKLFCCVLCGTSLGSKEALQVHFRKHANKEIDAKGNPMSKPGVSTEVEQQNTSNVTSKETIDCDCCTMKFETVTLAIQHKFRKHPDCALKYYCSYCGMQFPLKYTRDKHVKSHAGMSNKGEFKCPECDVIFHNNSAQAYHVKSIHKRILSLFKPIPTLPPSKKIKINNANEAQSVYYCHLCGSEYIVKFNLQKHLEKSHTAEERDTIPQDFIKCTTCDALFYNKKAYDTHNLYHKPDDLYVTSEEQRLQTVTRVDQDFDIRRVQLSTDKFIPVDKPKQRRLLRQKKTVKTNLKTLAIDSDEELSPTSSIESSESEIEIIMKQDLRDSDDPLAIKYDSNLPNDLNVGLHFLDDLNKHKTTEKRKRITQKKPLKKQKISNM